PTIIAEPNQRDRIRPIVGCRIRRLYRRCEEQQSSDHGLEHVITPSPTFSVQPPTVGCLYDKRRTVGTGNVQYETVMPYASLRGSRGPSAALGLSWPLTRPWAVRPCPFSISCSASASPPPTSVVSG